MAEEIEIITADLNSEGDRRERREELWTRVFTKCFLKVDDEVGGEGGRAPVARETVGSTAVVAIVCTSHIIVANCGDSRAVLCRGREAVALSMDHKVSILPRVEIFLMNHLSASSNIVLLRLLAQ